MLLVYTPKIGPRCRYIFRIFFNELFVTDFRLTDKVEEFAHFQGAKFSYSPQPLGNEFHITACGLLAENGIQEQTIAVSEWNGEKIFYTTGRHSALPFDPFAAAFFLVSRYEEYLPHIRDSHDRFDARESLAWKNGFLQKPVINRWARVLANLLISRFPELEFKRPVYSYVSTIDIDNAYAFREKGFMRTLGGYIKDLGSLDFENMQFRTKVLLGLKQDPYDTYEFLFALQKKYNLKNIYFFLVGDYGINDKNLPVESRQFQSLIKTVGDYAEVGVHPSYGSNKFPERLKAEVGRLA
ncbi:MAG TPA: hypothetical protein VNZ86_01750, partial [Bacteroidia bacterium]|nr:hypothetical protein [Bacteroidia bacterium]